MEKTPIKPEEIRKGDLIRFEYSDRSPRTGSAHVVEYVATSTSKVWTSVGALGQHYLLERPEPPFEPYWGMVIGNPNSIADRGVYLPSRKGDSIPWLAYNGGEGGQTEWTENSWARARLAEGWVVIEKPEGVK